MLRWHFRSVPESPPLPEQTATKALPLLSQSAPGKSPIEPEMGTETLTKPPVLFLEFWHMRGFPSAEGHFQEIVLVWGRHSCCTHALHLSFWM
jgi:hypothetical protein